MRGIKWLWCALMIIGYDHRAGYHEYYPYVTLNCSSSLYKNIECWSWAVNRTLSCVLWYAKQTLQPWFRFLNKHAWSDFHVANKSAAIVMI